MKGGINIGEPSFISSLDEFVKATEATRASILIELTTRLEELAGIRANVVYSIDPVNLSTGNFIYKKKDLSILGAHPLEFQRFYNALDVNTGPMGKNWRHSFEITLHKDPESKDISLYFEDGHLEYYTFKDGHYKSPIGYYSTLTEKDEGLFSLTLKDQTIYSFDEAGNLTSIKDTNNNETCLTYTQKEGHLDSVSNASGSFSCVWSSPFFGNVHQKLSGLSV